MKTRNLQRNNRALMILSACALMMSSSLLTACSGYKSSVGSTLADAGNGSTDTDGSNPGSPLGGAWGKLEVAGSVGGNSEFKGSQVLKLDKVNKELVITLPLPADGYLNDTQLSLDLPKFPGTKVQLDPMEDGKAALTLHVPLASLVKGVDFGDPTKLPNGRPLPGVPDGELPSEAVRLTNLTDISATIYLGKNVVGVFVNSPLDPLADLSFPIKNQDQTKTWGYLHTLKASTFRGSDGGFFIAVALPDDIARIIEDNL